MNSPQIPTKLQTFLLSPVTGNKKWWIRILLGLLVILPWIAIGFFLYLKKDKGDEFIKIVSTMKDNVDKQIAEHEKIDKELKQEEEKLIKESKELAKKVEKVDIKYAAILKEIKDAASSNNSITRLNSIRDRLNARVKQQRERRANTP